MSFAQFFNDKWGDIVALLMIACGAFLIARGAADTPAAHIGHTLIGAGLIALNPRPLQNGLPPKVSNGPETKN